MSLKFISVDGNEFLFEGTEQQLIKTKIYTREDKISLELSSYIINNKNKVVLLENDIITEQYVFIKNIIDTTMDYVKIIDIRYSSYGEDMINLCEVQKAILKINDITSTREINHIIKTSVLKSKVLQSRLLNMGYTIPNVNLELSFVSIIDNELCVISDEIEDKTLARNFAVDFWITKGKDMLDTQILVEVVTYRLTFAKRKKITELYPPSIFIINLNDENDSNKNFVKHKTWFIKNKYGCTN